MAIWLVLALFASCAVLLNTAAKNVKKMTYFDMSPNVFQCRSSKHATRVEKVAQILKLVLDATKFSTVAQNAKKATGKDTRLIAKMLN